MVPAHPAAEGGQDGGAAEEEVGGVGEADHLPHSQAGRQGAGGGNQSG